MPFLDPEKRRENQRRWYAEKLRRDEEFRASEAARKAEWLQTFEGRMSNAEASARYRARGRRQGRRR
jgi:hypothetical protein